MAQKKEPKDGHNDPAKPRGNEITIDAKTHRRLLRFINAARSPQDLAFGPQQEIPLTEPDPVLRRPNVDEQQERPKLIEFGQARSILEARDRISPLQGFAHIDQLREVIAARGLAPFFEELFKLLDHRRFGEWEDIGEIQTEDGAQIDVVHAAMLRTGWVMFIEAACGLPTSRTPIWNSQNRATVEIRLPTPPTDNLYCSGHSFLSDGRLLVVGGGGDLGDTPHPNFGWLFDPVSGPAGSWSFTKDAFNNRTFLNFDRRYPTLVTLGDVPGRVLIASGRSPRMEIYEELTGRFLLVTTPADRAFNPLYPGLHLLPGGEIFHAPVGFASGGSVPNDYPSNDPSGYFEFDNTDNLKGAWTNLEPNDRTKGFSLLLLSPTFPFAQIMIVGGGNADKSRTYQIINLSNLSPVWQLPESLPLAAGQTQPTGRVNVNPVLLPDGTVFVSGGALAGEPCWLFNPISNTWLEMDEAPRERRYHSHALLLPTGEVMSCGWHNNTIEVFKPPYLFKGPRPAINAVPEVIHPGKDFRIEISEGYDIKKVVLVRPMAPTHNTDSEQRVVQLQFSYTGYKTLCAIAPNGWHPHATAPRGWYMLFVINNAGIPSVAKFVHLD